MNCGKNTKYAQRLAEIRGAISSLSPEQNSQEIDHAIMEWLKSNDMRSISVIDGILDKASLSPQNRYDAKQQIFRYYKEELYKLLKNEHSITRRDKSGDVVSIIGEKVEMYKLQSVKYWQELTSHYRSDDDNRSMQLEFGVDGDGKVLINGLKRDKITRPSFFSRDDTRVLGQMMAKIQICYCG